MDASFFYLQAKLIQNHLTQERFSLVPLDDNFFPANACDQIVKIVNQPLIYSLLFSEKLKGRAYNSQDAEGFLEWAQRGWREGSYFVFLILTPRQTIAGAIDIKSNNPESAEIGYWMSDEHPGVMTNAVKELVNSARQAGYRELFAWTRETNLKSAGVLRRAGFYEMEQQALRLNRFYKRFTIDLT